MPLGLLRDANAPLATAQQLWLGVEVAVASIALSVGRSLGTVLGAHARSSTDFAIASTLMALIPLLATADALRLGRSAGDGLRRGS